MFKKIFAIFALVAIMAMPVVASAQLSRGTNAPDTGNLVPATGISDVYTTLNNIANIMLGILIAIAVLFIIYAAYLYLTSAGNDAKTKEARNYILYALIAIVVGFVAKGLVGVVKSISTSV